MKEGLFVVILKTALVLAQILIITSFIYIVLKQKAMLNIYLEYPEFFLETLPILIFVLSTLLLLFIIARFFWEIMKSMN